MCGIKYCLAWLVFTFIENSSSAALLKVSNIQVSNILNQNIFLVRVKKLLEKHLDYQGTMTVFPTGKHRSTDSISSTHWIYHPSHHSRDHRILNNIAICCILSWSISYLFTTLWVYVCAPAWDLFPFINAVQSAALAVLQSHIAAPYSERNTHRH